MGQVFCIMHVQTGFTALQLDLTFVLLVVVDLFQLWDGMKILILNTPPVIVVPANMSSSDGEMCSCCFVHCLWTAGCGTLAGWRCWGHWGPLQKILGVRQQGWGLSTACFNIMQTAFVDSVIWFKTGWVGVTCQLYNISIWNFAVFQALYSRLKNA